MSNVSLEQLLGDASWFSEKIDFKNDLVQFIKMDRYCYSKSSFLSGGRALRQNIEPLSTSFSQLNYLLNKEFPNDTLTQDHSPCFIFHTAFCGSTLLSRLLDDEDTTLVLREPFCLNQVAMQERLAIDENSMQELLNTIFILLNRSWKNQKIIIKADDYCNNLISMLFKRTMANKGLLLHSSVTRFITAVLKNDARKKWLQTALEVALTDAKKNPDYFPIPIKKKIDSLSEIAAYVWSIRTLQCIKILEQNPMHLKSLDFEVFVANSLEAVTACANHFELSLTQTQIQAQLNDETLNKHSKSGKAFNLQTYRDDKKTIENKLKEEIDTAQEWIEKNTTLTTNITLSNPLM